MAKKTSKTDKETTEKVDAQTLETRIKELEEKNEALIEINKALEIDNKRLADENTKLKEDLEQPSKPPMTKEEFLKNRPTINVNGKKYGFKFDAPATLSIKGVVMKTSELIKNEEQMKELISGNAPFVELVN